MSSLYLRYIDDIFFPWHGSKEELKSFFKEINEVHETIKFDIEYSYHHVNFLDTTVTLSPSKTLETSLYQKPTHRHVFLHKKSHHPSSTKRNIICSQAYRIKRICSKEENYRDGIAELQKQFLQRDHLETEIEYEITKVLTVRSY